MRVIYDRAKLTTQFWDFLFGTLLVDVFNGTFIYWYMVGACVWMDVGEQCLVRDGGTVTQRLVWSVLDWNSRNR